MGVPLKPDLVISDGANRALCVEAKWESTEGAYTATGAEQAVLTARGIPGAHQREVQQFLMQDLLAFDTTFVYLVRTPSAPAASGTISWREAFESLDLSEGPPFIRDWVAAL